MDKKLRINIGLLGFIIFLSIVLLNTEDNSEKELLRLSKIDPDDIVQIKILRKNRDDFEFNKQNEIWNMTLPQQFRANNARINAMLRILKVESFAQLNPVESDLEKLGLGNPVIIMRLNDHEFKFGDIDAIDQRRYVFFNEKIHLINDFLYQQLMTNAAFFVDPKLLPENFEINSIQFPENKIELIEGKWQLKKLMDINPDQIKRIVFSWENASAISTEKYQAPKPATKSVIEITGLSNKVISFRVVSTEPHLILARKDLGVQFHMSGDESKKLLLIEAMNISEETEPTTGFELH